MIERIALVTDFGPGGPYVGQMRGLLSHLVPATPVFELVSDLPPFLPRLAAYLLPALARDLPKGTCYVCVVDPGVGGDRLALAVEADGDWFVGPDNGLLAPVVRRASRVRALRVDWRPAWCSQSFHGRDLFAPIAAMLCRGEPMAASAVPVASLVGMDDPDDLAAVVYVDYYGNLITGLRAASLSVDCAILVGPRVLSHGRTFCAVPPGTAFWYENAFGLVELAVCQGRADLVLGLRPGDGFRVVGGSGAGSCARQGEGAA